MRKITKKMFAIPVIDCDTIPIDREISDHDGTYVSIDCGYCNRKTFQRIIWDYKRRDYLLVDDKNVINVMRKITKKMFVHISQTDNISILIMSLLKHMLKILPVITILYFLLRPI
jgi:hypothetical protein